MAENVERMNSMLFDYKTTSRTDFCDGEILPIVKTVYQSKPAKVKPPMPPAKSHQTLAVCKGYIPFSLYHRTKDVVRDDPRKVQQPYDEVRDSKELLQAIQKTRPRVFITPAFSLDDCDPDTHEMLIKEFYQTTSSRASEGVLERFRRTHNVKSPLSPVYESPSPIKIKQLCPCYVSPEWRMKSVSWDSQQLRGYIDPTREFWLKRKPKCDVCDQTRAREANKRIKN